jgi:hypothetical protein
MRGEGAAKRAQEQKGATEQTVNEVKKKPGRNPKEEGKGGHATRKGKGLKNTQRQ